jgi:hypothetical protein
MTPDTRPPGGDLAPLPPDLAAELIELLAAALVADYRQYPNLADLPREVEATVQSRSGHDRNSRGGRTKIRVSGPHRGKGQKAAMASSPMLKKPAAPRTH